MVCVVCVCVCVCVLIRTHYIVSTIKSEREGSLTVRLLRSEWPSTRDSVKGLHRHWRLPWLLFFFFKRVTREGKELQQAHRAGQWTKTGERNKKQKQKKRRTDFFCFFFVCLLKRPVDRQHTAAEPFTNQT